MGTKLYIGNLSYEINEDELRELFSEQGEITSISIVADPYTGRSRGFAFVETADEETAEAVIEALNDLPLKGRNLRVALATPIKQQPLSLETED
ncbi:MAG: RNA-binding protein [Anaerolineae bacterium]|nr:RNA-binding protein [Anaerolineae bacterium]